MGPKIFTSRLFKQTTIAGVTRSDGVFSRGGALFCACVQASDFRILLNKEASTEGYALLYGMPSKVGS